MPKKVTDIRVYKSDKRIQAAQQAMYENAAGAIGVCLEQMDATGAPPGLIFAGALKALTLYVGRHQAEIIEDALMRKFLEAVNAASQEGPADVG